MIMYEYDHTMSSKVNEKLPKRMRSINSIQVNKGSIQLIGLKLQDSYNDQHNWVLDSSLDSRGHVPLRARTGAWKAALFIIAIEFSERLSYFGLATNLVVYLTTIIHQDLKTAVKNVNYWSGVTTLMPLFGGFVADAYLGRYTTVLVATTIYLMGLVLLTMSWFIPGLKPCHKEVCVEPRKAHEIAFFIAIYLISIGTGGHKPCLESFGADQFDDDHVEERKMRMSYFNWWNVCLCAGILTSVTVLVYIEDRVGWGVASIIFTTIMAISLLIFLIGKPFYRYRTPSGSPLTPMLQVLVAAIAKRNLPYPSDPSLLHEVSKAEFTTGRLLSHSKHLKHITGNNSFTVPPASMFSLTALSLIISLTIYHKIFVPLLRRVTRNQRGINILQRIGTGMLFSLTTMIIAALVEKKRLDRSENNEPMSVIWLAPQFIVIGVADAFTLVGLQEYFYDQVPDSMRSLGIAIYLSVLGAANFLNNLLITAVDTLADDFSAKSWFGKDLNSSRLDRFYWFLAGVTAANICVFVVVAKRCPYKSVQPNQVVVDSYLAKQRVGGGGISREPAVCC
ncbi:hypothetical protein F2Q70_00008524 [Brassica cretica]|uniref:Uncharacterized protein n=1 Tax=Brassica cretica TaxID=69181 RepID=A0A8S9JJQ1_BRACR|nr:hypothetical protein F2Q68_00001571 [Brassica cretica]KAF2613703.1 hypothetical protein F2Q70_00008524 [Brassica cretica]